MATLVKGWATATDVHREGILIECLNVLLAITDCLNGLLTMVLESIG